MSNKEVTFHGNKLWFARDHLTENTLALSLFYCADEWGLSTLKVKLEVSNYKKRIDNHVFLEHRDVCNYVATANNHLAKLKKETTDNPEYKQTLSFVSNFKTKVRTSFLIKAEFENRYMTSVIFTDRETGLTDSERVFVSLQDYCSCIEVLTQFKNNYLICMDSALNRISTEAVLEKIDNISEKLTNYTSQIYGRLHTLENTEDVKPTTIVVDSEGGQKQSQVDSYIRDNVDKMNFDLDTHLNVIKEKEVVFVKPELQISVLDEDCFTAKVLEGGIKMLEEIALGCVLDDIPLLKLLKLISTKLQIPEDKMMEKFFPECNVNDFNTLLYLNTRYIKYVMNEHIEDKKPMRESVQPMYINCKNLSKFNISLMYDLLLYFAFYTHLKAQLQKRIQGTTRNKSVVNFVIKALFSPFVFGYIDKGSTKETIISEIKNRYKKYKENKVFDSIITEVKKAYGDDIEISEESITKTVDSVCTVAINNKDKYEIKAVAGDFKVAHKTPISLIFEVNNLETVRKILIIEALYATNNKIDKAVLKDQKGIDTLNDIPNSVLEVFNLGEKKVNKENLVRIIDDEMKSNTSLVYHGQAIDAVKLINTNYRDLKDKNIDFSNFSDNVLKAFVIWDIEEDEKIQDNYAYFKSKIEGCTIDRNMALSMLINMKDKTVSDYSNSLKVSKIN